MKIRANILLWLGLVLTLIAVLVPASVAFAQDQEQGPSGENAWWAWIPILNAILLLNIAKKPLWWFILLLIPLVGLIIAIIVWMAVAEARGKPSWWGILLIVPLVGIIVPGYLAWSD